MPENEIIKEELGKLMAMPGQIKGASFKGDMEYILAKKGAEGLKAVERETEKLGYPIKYGGIEEADWYAVGLRMVSFCAIMNVFQWGKKELGELAETAPRVSFIVRIFMRFFLSLERVFKTAMARLWERYYNIGSLEALYFKNTKEKHQAVFRIKNFKLHPFYCFFLSHFFIGISKLVDPKIKKITMEETKCSFKGNPYHEYVANWTY